MIAALRRVQFELPVLNSVSFSSPSPTKPRNGLFSPMHPHAGLVCGCACGPIGPEGGPICGAAELAGPLQGGATAAAGHGGATAAPPAAVAAAVDELG